MKLPDAVIHTRDPELQEWMDYVSLILNNGRYQLRVVDEVPTHTTHEGEFLLYASGDTRELYAYVNSQWVKISWATTGGISEITGVFGDWTSVSKDTSYEATTDGFVCAYAKGGSDVQIKGLTDSSDPPTTVRQWTDMDQSDSTGEADMCLPVKKGEYYLIQDLTGTLQAIYWIPLGVAS